MDCRFAHFFSMVAVWPVRTLMAPADECEYTYHELIKVLNGETQPEDYAGVSSAYKLLANDVSETFLLMTQ